LQGEPEEVVKAIAKGDLEAASAAGLEPNRRAMFEYVRKITFDARSLTAEDAETLRQQGYTDEQIAEVVYIAALFAFFNRVADAFGIEGRGLLEMPLDEMRKILTR
jgi:alkylhydroperoxidase family enzyme